MLITCFHCGRSQVSEAGICPSCRLPPHQSFCGRCKCGLPRGCVLSCCETCEQQRLVEERARERVELVEKEGGVCVGCGRLVNPDVRKDAWHKKTTLHTGLSSNDYSERWSTHCGSCGHTIEWNQCPRCHKIHFGPLELRSHILDLGDPSFKKIKVTHYGCKSCITKYSDSDATGCFGTGCLGLVALACAFVGITKVLLFIFT